MLVTYIGTDDARILNRDDLVRAGFEVDEEFEPLVWTPGSTLEVDDEVGAHITEFMREQFKNRSDTTRDLRSKDELMERAGELEIVGRSKMNRDELLDAITAEEIRLESAPDESNDEGIVEEQPEEA